MRSPASAFATSSATFSSTASDHWFASTRSRLAAATLAVMAAIMVPAALFSSTGPAVQAEPKFACATIDWRVGEKLAMLDGRTDARTRAIVNSVNHQRDVARTQCGAGSIDAAMDIYRVLDRSLTRYVQYGTAPALPK